jgi:hypothetical protein
MKQNVGGIDKVIRLVLGLALAGYGYYAMMWWLLAIGVVVFLTGVFSRCAVYSIFGISTCPVTPEVTKSPEQQ